MKIIRYIRGTIALAVAGFIGIITLGLGLLSLLAREWLVAGIFLAVTMLVVYILVYRREDAFEIRYRGEDDDLTMGRRRR